MTITRTVAAVAEDGKQGMTLDELAAFVQEAMRAGVPGESRIRARVNFTAGIKRLETR
ncbi:hypothetical protein [Streptosporangium sp. NPDC049078]|uniref:hypothetical protein n=1 Tax=Streptosporangium sp. NPDC049078 TaxID=3155767 RepID=UPI003418D526